MRPPRQIGWVISVEDWALIRRLVADGVPQRQVARELGIGRPTVARAVASEVPPKYASTRLTPHPVGSKVARRIVRSSQPPCPPSRTHGRPQGLRGGR
jgi:hypothetical protein